MLIVVLATLAVVVVVAGLFILKRMFTQIVADKQPQVCEQPASQRRPQPRGAARRRHRVHHSDSEDEPLQRAPIERDEIADSEKEVPSGKMGAKKTKKLEEKAARKTEREEMERIREEKKAFDEKMMEERNLKDEKLRAEEKAVEDAERLLREEQRKRELEEYLLLKEQMTVEEAGEQKQMDEDYEKNLLEEFVQYIKKQKVVVLESLAAKFQLKTPDCIERVKFLAAEERITGVFDDRGKFIYITIEELQGLAGFIKQKGRISISELAQQSNQYINLMPEVSNVDLDLEEDE